MDEEILVQAIEFANLYDVAIQLMDVDAKYYYAGRDEERGAVTLYLSSNASGDITALRIMVMLLQAHQSTWINIGEDTAALSECIAKIAQRHKSEAAA